MKRILVVIDNVTSAKSLIEKSIRLTPEQLFIVVVGHSIVMQVEAILSQQQNNRAKTEVIAVSDHAETNTADEVIQLALNHDIDAVVVHRPNIRDESCDFSLEKKLLRGLSKASLFMCGDKRWKSQLNVLATVDIIDESAEQKNLNSLVCDASNSVAKLLSAGLHLMSVINISRVGEELDIVTPSEVLTEKGSSVKAKLEHYILGQNLSDQTKIHVAAGAPYKVIPSLAKKAKIDLVVLGNVGRTGLKGLVVGNTAEKILRWLSVDVLIVKK